MSATPQVECQVEAEAIKGQGPSWSEGEGRGGTTGWDVIPLSHAGTHRCLESWGLSSCAQGCGHQE